ncbi:hypothetical protein PM082_004977 [Marasmius tenuissimus]|nr:hypothetical protein PM082_004977 [Marasmius tenuissimus]
MASIPKPCTHCNECDNFESDPDNSDADRSRVACIHCACKRKDHHASTNTGSKRKQGARAKAIFDSLLDGDEAEQLLESANKEAKAGLKSKSKKTKAKDQKGAEKGKKKHLPSSKTFCLGTVFMDVRGTSKTTVDGLKVLKPKFAAVPSRRALFEATQRGHAAQFTLGLEIPSNATFDDIDKLIRKSLPKPFEYLDSTWNQSYPPYVFAGIKKQKLELCQHLLQPTGDEIQQISRGPTGRGTESNRLFIVTRKPIPQHIVASWPPSSIADVDDDDADEDDDDDKSSNDEEREDTEGIVSDTLKTSVNSDRANKNGSSKETNRPARKYQRRILESDGEESDGCDSNDGTVSDRSTMALRPRKKARIDPIDLTQDNESNDFEMTMAEFEAMISGTSDSNNSGSGLFLPGTPPAQFSTPSTSTVNPQYSDPRPENDPYTNKPDLDF